MSLLFLIDRIDSKNIDRDLLSLGNPIDLPHWNSESDLRSGEKVAGNRKRGKTRKDQRKKDRKK